MREANGAGGNAQFDANSGVGGQNEGRKAHAEGDSYAPIGVVDPA